MLSHLFYLFIYLKIIILLNFHEEFWVGMVWDKVQFDLHYTQLNPKNKHVISLFN